MILLAFISKPFLICGLKYLGLYSPAVSGATETKVPRMNRPLLPRAPPYPDPDLTNGRAMRRTFTPEEDVLLKTLVDHLGPKNWEAVCAYMPTRSARQCRDRYSNYLVDNLSIDPWSPDEDALILEKFRELGPRWVQIATFVNGRSGNQVKNRWHKHLSKHRVPPGPIDVPEPPPTRSLRFPGLFPGIREMTQRMGNLTRELRTEKPGDNMHWPEPEGRCFPLPPVRRPSN
jgi:hypothetical protein